MSAIRALRMAPRRAAFVRAPVAALRPQRSYAAHAELPYITRQHHAQAHTLEVYRMLTSKLPQNGNYPDTKLTTSLPVKRQFRDPYGDWWDKQERRNYGETVHEDNDVLGIFSPEEYTHVTPGWGAVQWSAFLATTGFVLGAVYQYYPDKASVPRAFPGGLERELGGSGAVRARKSSDEESIL
ncbi:hypothetical protein K431DRAFT_321008 [Polychaeton citri CBS 116435]|uniref:Uncharacterized protein n=1 Tax=Polychaeton citri CBS 116435 TaxID=1314669 RepID=A0A9P4UN89_9PEZI|nr:hypothetical protein K431DRAFT_321008 [Polychaeton citri CBS 116435]